LIEMLNDLWWIFERLRRTSRLFRH
jgi:hypothetical protein